MGSFLSWSLWVGRIEGSGVLGPKLKRPPEWEVERAGICGRALVDNYQRQRVGTGPHGHSLAILPRRDRCDNTR